MGLQVRYITGRYLQQSLSSVASPQLSILLQIRYGDTQSPFLHLKNPSVQLGGGATGPESKKKICLRYMCYSR